MTNSTLTNTKKLEAQITHKAQSGSSKAMDALTAVALDAEALVNFLVATQNVTANLTAAQRRRLIGSRVKNYGFIDKSFDIMRDNPDFMPTKLDNAEMTEAYRRFETLRQIVTLTAHLNRVAVDLFMLQSDVCYRLGLRVYRNLQSMAKSMVPGATDLFQTLRWHFMSHGNRKRTEPTQKELERDAKKLIEGKADGSMLIENERPRVIDGKHTVVDNIKTGKVAVEEVSENHLP